MTYTDFEIDSIFNKIWDIYPCKERPAAGKKALAIALKTGSNHEEIVQAAKIYSMENEGQEFTYHFVNFINDEHWKDILSYYKNAKDRIKVLEFRRKLGLKIIRDWNKACRSHWCECIDAEMRVPIVVAALENEFFRNNWNKALTMAKKLFYTTQDERSKFKSLTLSLRWFCTVTPIERHTVMRLIEGEYGKPYTPTYKKPEEKKSLTPEERDSLDADLQDVFGDTPYFKKETKELEEKPKPVINEEMKKLVDSAVELGINEDDDSDPFEFK